MGLTQRQINHGVFGLLFIVTAATLTLLLFRPNVIGSSLVLAAGAFGVCGLLWVAYWRGWNYAPQTLIVLLTALVAFAMPTEIFDQEFNHAIYIMPVLALVLTGPIWVLGSATFLLSTFIYRAGGGAYSESINLLIFIMVIGGMIFSRLAVDNVQRLEEARREAERQREHAETERERVAQQAQELAQRNRDQERLLELVTVLETPTITVAEGVLLAPIVGSLDSRRAQALTSRLLHEASAQRIRRVILDISGVSAVDTQVAQSLLQAAQGLELLGCEVVLTGISATVATTMTHLGIALNGITTLRSPQEALTLVGV